MLLVIMIIGILAGAVVVGLSGRSQDARMTRAKADISGSLSLALDLFDQDVGRYPTADEGLKALVEDRNIAGWRGPYLKGGLKADPWGQPYYYEVNSNLPRHYVLKSAGPDGQAGTDDDILQ
jgi:general secretion pathway protein G